MRCSVSGLLVLTVVPARLPFLSFDPYRIHSLLAATWPPFSSIPPDMPTTDPDTPQTLSPSIFNWILGFLLVGMAWGLTTPFMHRAAANGPTVSHPSLEDSRNNWIWKKALGVFWGVVDTVRRPSYAIPFLLNVTGSVWFFLLIGKAGRYIGCSRN